MDTFAITVDQLTHRYDGSPVIDGLSCQFLPGATAIVGPNGAGKSTLLRILATAEPCQQQEAVTIAGLPPSRRNLSAIRRRVGYLPQTFGFDGRFSVRDFVTYVGTLKNVNPALLRTRVEDAIQTVGLVDRATTPLKALSGGMLRRVGIAQAIVNAPDILILDEPTAGLDQRQRQGFRDLIARLSADNRLVLFSTHLTDDLFQVADRLLVIDEGRDVWNGTLQELVGARMADTRQIEMQLARHLSLEPPGS